MNTFIETGTLNGKKIVAFCTSGSSGVEASMSALKGYGLEVIGDKRFGSFATENEVEEWLKGL